MSILIATRNRAGDLRETLASLAATRIPPGMAVELVVVDNGSTDGTAEVARGAAVAAGVVSRRVLVYVEPGKSRALNRAVKEAGGDVLLFTDDDVRVPADWVGPMVAPIVAGEADCVAGRLPIAAHLRRPWQTHVHLALVASTEPMGGGSPGSMIGANMAVSRAAWEAVGGLDPLLGPGTGRLSEDTLFSWRAAGLGLRLWGQWGPAVEHHFDASRMERPALLAYAATFGRDDAWLAHHWLHGDARWAGAKAAVYGALAAIAGVCCGRGEAAPAWELGLVRRAARAREAMALAGTPRRYGRRGAEAAGAELVSAGEAA